MKQRELKFRIWDDILKIMYTPEMDEKYKNLWEIPAIEGGVLKVRDKIMVMQYTGLKDRNGKEVYVGDILQTENEKYTVAWSDDFCSFGLRITKRSGKWKSLRWIIKKEFEVIGNLYQNPELL